MDEKEYQAGVWYGADVKPPDARMVLVDTANGRYKAGFYYDKEHTWYTRVKDPDYFESEPIKYWMLIPDIPKE